MCMDSQARREGTPPQTLLRPESLLQVSPPGPRDGQVTRAAGETSQDSPSLRGSEAHRGCPRPRPSWAFLPLYKRKTEPVPCPALQGAFSFVSEACGQLTKAPGDRAGDTPCSSPGPGSSPLPGGVGGRGGASCRERASGLRGGSRGWGDLLISCNDLVPQTPHGRPLSCRRGGESRQSGWGPEGCRPPAQGRDPAPSPGPPAQSWRLLAVETRIASLLRTQRAAGRPRGVTGSGLCPGCWTGPTVPTVPPLGAGVLRGGRLQCAAPGFGRKRMQNPGASGALHHHGVGQAAFKVVADRSPRRFPAPPLRCGAGPCALSSRCSDGSFPGVREGVLDKLPRS